MSQWFANVFVSKPPEKNSWDPQSGKISLIALSCLLTCTETRWQMNPVSPPPHEELKSNLLS